ncbi:some similarities with Saccharomyces cerevisiae YOR083W WHI5 Repressor of G1 transcription that binds to SCB binding factor (SBF) at SCB target promoters in early G1 [Maudiozyma barnettii]|uniref:Some similarities with Saccharomyces cerevisiae YOR083W WHI5 Repressor of G1 transcription that binds to SCB binding factor (SBF) at SCB target promoters in early G1 n=1 Tax=Maudiozyma barnettii TaxID=61262 RepID=A0A8H2VIV1_9SACH|nr:transcriptional repressor WHI5 [Kazachstania barnettii]CAB4256257.1 some similarities with Saccharomyces cerevisiae YOR083W WHI5 Repressor of G1 transcription that binds to SCB binding factor (SBF) at SCB target promoters in early G1 [Kazachstania barnettii]CAD1784866.1 some similarities with Saccharomyces cerevisiae YOR083W WHI5 Repressor of G1 transcription that binds to SCB binding factor (SBF) at SCB target promoters in early G1 [Kazachstania barnettii]
MQGKVINKKQQPLSELSLRDSDRINIKHPQQQQQQQQHSNYLTMMSPKGYGNDDSSSSLKNSPRNQNDNTRTPRHSQNNTSNNNNNNDMDYPMTPSPPNKVRRSSASMSFLATPKFNSLNNLSEQQQVLSHKKLRSHNSSDNEEEEEEQQQHEAAIPFSPTSRSTRLLPPTTPKSRNIETFLSPSPHITSPSIYKESNKPIREISNNLKTRLNYAFVKLQNGWVDRTLPELENELDRQQTLIQQRQHLQNSHFSPQRSVHLSPAHSISSSYTNKFAYGNGINMDEDTDNLQDEERSDSTNSARLAFMKALSSPARGQVQSHHGLPSSSSTLSDSSRILKSGNMTSQKNNIDNNSSSSPLKWSQDSRKPSNQVKEPFKEISKETEDNSKIQPKKKEGATEVAAIETLMSLSSPKKSKPTVSFNDNSTQDTENDTEVDDSDNSISN